ncbi:MAG: type 2 isopentenyl-diphosphate Delta-isomerase [Thermoprotei archaeon]|nr:MAG: type 2 isopentenyl-diphosphate Delta-isomerase [Thermoprotei archaeon]
MTSVIEERKREHVEIAIREKVEYEVLTTWLEDVYLIHQAMPTISPAEISTEIEVFGKKLNAPVLIAALTGGYDIGKKLNANIASVVEELGLGMYVGSQRAAIERSELRESFVVVKELAPSALKIANLGAAQLKADKFIEYCKTAVDMIDADAIAIHLNPLQEYVQPEGEAVSMNILDVIKQLREELGVPIVVKEVGCGISMEVARRLSQVNVDAIDVGGAGGTSFAKIERIRAEKRGRYLKAKLAELFSEWGIPTAVSICEVRYVFDGYVIACGGIRTGLDVAKSIALGSDLAAIGLEVLRRAYVSKTSLREYLVQVIEGLKLAMYLLDVENIEKLRTVPLVLSPRLLTWLQQRGIDPLKYIHEVRTRGGILRR